MLLGTKCAVPCQINPETLKLTLALSFYFCHLRRKRLLKCCFGRTACECRSYFGRGRLMEGADNSSQLTSMPEEETLMNLDTN